MFRFFPEKKFVKTNEYDGPRPRPGACSRAVMQPFLEARFTPGIVDGGQRGSSQGLGALLKELLEYVKEVQLAI